MKNRILFVSFFLFYSFLSSQLKTAKYYIEFKNETVKPKFERIANDRVVLTNPNKEKFLIKSIKKEFETFKNEKLKNTDIIEFINEQDFYNFLSLYRNYIVNYEKIQESEEYELLYTPDDYYLVDSPIAHTHLDLINAKEAWDYAKGDNIIVGVPDSGFRVTHVEFKDKINFIDGKIPSNGEHGNWVAGLAGGNTNNNYGNSSIGFNNKLLVSNNTSLSNLKKMSDLGAKVINMSWLSSCTPYQYYQLALNEIVEQGTVLVAASGNDSTCGSPLNHIYPASYDNVISVSGVGHLNEVDAENTRNVKDVHLLNYAENQNTTHHNEAVDIVAPAFDITGLPGKDGDYSLSRIWTGTSFSAPIVSGAVSLMFSANSCLSPNEIETILKMTSANIEHIKYNQPFIGLLGAGRLDAGKATKISKLMTLNKEIVFEDKIFHRWNFELLNSPYKIKFIDYKFLTNSNTLFKAKESIVLTDGTEFKPINSASHKLWIDNSDTCFIVNNVVDKEVEDNKPIKYESIKKNEIMDVFIYPTIVKDKIVIKSRFERDDIALLTIIDLNGRELLRKKVDFKNLEEIYIYNLPKGVYFVSLKNKYLNINTKIIKK
ncbi:MAG: S8 family serine peptidase [Cruoricaptor ignavus]|nr:S8 family serine peptidase [Cruoricaptor ignavus]